MLQVRELAYQKRYTDYSLTLYSFVRRGRNFLHYLLSPEDSSAGSKIAQNSVHENRHYTLPSIIKVLFWLTTAISFTSILGTLS